MPWCPDIPAVVQIDGNMWGSIGARSRDEIVGLAESRPVEVGEVVILSDPDHMLYGRCSRKDDSATYFTKASRAVSLEDPDGT